MRKLFWKKKKELYASIERALSRAQDAFLDRIKSIMMMQNLMELKGNEYRYKLVPCPKKLVIDDEKELPSAFKMQVVAFDVDKERVKAVLEEGLPVPGAHLEGGFALRCYEVKE